MLVIVMIGALVLGGAAFAAVLGTQGSDEPGPTPSSPTPSESPTAGAAGADYVPPAVPAVGPEALLEAGAGWALTQVWTGADAPVQWNLLFLSSPTGGASRLELPAGVTVEFLDDWLPGTTLAVVHGVSEEFDVTTSVVDLATGEALSSRTSESGEYVEMRFVGDGSTDVVVAAGPSTDEGRAERVHTVVRATADGAQVAASQPFALSSDTLAGSSWGVVEVSPDASYLLTGGHAGTLVLDAATLGPVPLVMPPDATRCDQIAWLGRASVSASCHYHDDAGRYVRSELWRAVVGGEEPRLMLNSATVDEYGDVRGAYLPGEQTVIDFDQSYGSDDAFPAGLYRLHPYHGDLVPVRTADDADSPRPSHVVGVVGDHLLAYSSGEGESISLVLVHGESGAVQPVIEGLAVRSQNVSTVMGRGTA